MGNLNIVYIFAITFFYTDFLYLYFYHKILKCKYSLKTAAFITIGMWMFDCTVKLVPQYVFEIDQSVLLNVIMTLSSIVYVLLVFRGTVIKRLMATLVYMIIQMIMDLSGMELAMLFTGSKEIFDAEYLSVAAFCSCLMITLGTVACVWVWKRIEDRKWKIDNYQWFCMLLPISQYIIFQGVAARQIRTLEYVNTIVALGGVIAFLADIIMLWMFEKSNARRKAEIEMRYLNQQYELEKMRYEQLKESQEEMAKMRHDFQNYVLTLKQME